MAVEKYKFTDQQNIRTAAEALFKSTNTRIKERILTSSSYTNDYQDSNHVLSAAALYTLIGQLEAYETNDGTGSDVVSKIKALDLAIGETTDTAEDETVYGAIAAVNDRIAALTHLTYQVVQGDITEQVPMAEAAEDVIYLQRKDPSFKVGRDGLVLDSSDNVVVVGDPDAEYTAYLNQGNGNFYKANVKYVYLIGDDPVELASSDAIFDDLDISEPTEGLLFYDEALVVSGTAGARYAAFWDATAEKWYKAVQTRDGFEITSTVLDSEDDVFENVDLVPDDTYTLYVCQITVNQEGERTGIQWLEVGNTDITLTDYYSKSDYDVRELQQRIMEPMSAQTIIDQVHAAFDATDPYGVNAATTSYLDSWLPVAP